MSDREESNQTRSVRFRQVTRLALAIALVVSTGVLNGSLRAQGQRNGPNQIVDSRAVLSYVNDVLIPAQADGIIMELVADEGDFASASSLLISLDTRIAKAELAVAEKEFEAAKKKADDKSNIEFQKKSLEVALMRHKMSQELRKTGAESKMQEEVNRLEAEKARLGGQVAQVEHAVAEAQADVSDRKKYMATVQVDLREIKAPFDGVVAERKRQAFEWVRVGEPIIRFVGMDSLYVIGNIPTDQLAGPPHLLEGSAATAIITLYKGEDGRATEPLRIPGRLDFVSPTVTINNAYVVKMKIPNTQDNGKWLLREGMECTLVVEAPSRVPAAAQIPSIRKQQ